MARSVEALTAAGALGMAASVFAQHGPPVPLPGDDPPAAPTAPAKDELKPSAALEFFGEHTFAANFDGSPGEVSVSRAGVNLSAEFPLDKERVIGLSVGAAHSWYEFDGATGFVSSGEPWDNVVELDLSVLFRGKFNERWGYAVAANVNDSYESGADAGDGLTFGGGAGVTYRASDKLTVGLGLAVTSRLEDNAQIIPYPIVRWQINDRWRLGTSGSSRQVGVVLSYAPTEAWTFSLKAGVEAHAFRLEDTGPAPDGVGRDWHLPVTLLAAWKIDPQVTLSAWVGVQAWQQYTLDDTDGNEIAEIDADAAMLAGIGVEFRF